MSGKSIFRAEVLEDRRAAWLGEAVLTPPRKGWIFLSIAMLAAASMLIATATFTRVEHDWVRFSMLESNSSDGRSSPGDFSVTARIARPDLIMSNPSTMIRATNGNEEQSATITGCRLLDTHDEQGCDGINVPHRVVLTVAPSAGAQAIFALGERAPRLRLPTGERQMLASLTRSSTAR